MEQKEERKTKNKAAFAFAMMTFSLILVTGIASAATTYHVPDDYTTIQAAVNAATAGDTIIVRDGTYTENVVVNPQLTIRSENGSASTIVQAANPGDHVFEVKANNVTIAGFTVTGATNRWTVGIHLSNANHCNISDNIANLNYWAGIRLQSSSNNTIANNTVKSNIEGGLLLRSSSNNRIENNTAINNSIVLRESSNNNLIIGNNASLSPNFGIRIESNSQNNTITGNTVSSNGDIGIELRESTYNNTLSGNIANGNGNNGIRLYGAPINPCSHNMVENNTAARNGNAGIHLHNATNCSIINNNASSNSWNGISLRYGSCNNLLENNTAYNNSGEAGIIIRASSNKNIITKNIVTENSQGIMILEFSSNNTVIDNDVYSNNGAGVVITQSAPNNNITCNIIRDNTGPGGRGIMLSTDSNNNRITDNQVVNNSVEGIVLGSNTTLINNTVIDSGAEGIAVYSQNNVITDNHVRNSSKYGILLASNENTVANNTVTEHGWPAIFLHSSSYNYLINNTVAGNQEKGIYLESNSSNNNISDNNVSYNDIGIYLLGSKNNTLTNNSVNLNNDHGIYLYSSSHNILTNNTANSNHNIHGAAYGIWLRESSNYNTLMNNNASDNEYGINLLRSHYNTITGNIANSNAYDGIWPDSYNTFINNTASKNKRHGIYLRRSKDNVLRNNTANYNRDTGIFLTGMDVLYECVNNMLENNTANSNGEYGIHLDDSCKNHLTGNTMSGNKYNFRVASSLTALSVYTHNVDTSNKVEGKPIYFLVDKKDQQIPTDAGTVCVVNSTNITVKDLTLTKNGQGVLFAYTTNSRIENVSAPNNVYGIYVVDMSYNNTLRNNTANSNYAGICMRHSEYNTLASNTANTNDHYGIYVLKGDNNMLRNNTLNSNGYYGIYLKETNKCTLTGNTGNSNDYNGFYLHRSCTYNTLENNTACENGRAGIHTYYMGNNYNNFTGNIANSNDWYGISLEDSNHCTLTHNTALENRDGIALRSSSRNNLTSNNVSNNTEYDFFSNQNSHNNAVKDLRISSYPTTISFTYDNGIKIKGVDTAPGDPAGKENISKYVDATDVSANSWLFLNVSYRDVDISGVQESTLRLWKNNGSWYEVEGSGVNEAENYVYANITEFSIFAPLGSIPSAGLNCTCGDICVNETGWWRDGDVFNPSLEPIWAAVNSSAVGETVCVKDGTYNENVDVTKSHLTIQSENGSASTIVQAANTSDHVFEVKANNVTISGFTVTGATNRWTVGIHLSNANHCNISNNIANSNNWAGIRLRASSNNTIANNTVNSNIEQGIILRESSNNRIENNTVINNSHSGILLRESSSNNQIISNNASLNSNSGILIESNSQNNTITSNTANSNGDIGISLREFTYSNTLSGNIANNNGNNGISLYGTAGNPCLYNIVENNTAARNKNVGIRLDNTCNCSITNNNASSNFNGIGLYYGSCDNLLENNTAYNNTGEAGIIVRHSSNNCIITRNIVTENIRGIMILESSSNNTVIDNEVYSNYKEGGIVIGGLASNNNITRNKIHDNSGSGGRGVIISGNSNNNRITDNLLINNSAQGILLEFDSNNSMVINNTVIDSGSDGIGVYTQNNVITDNYVWNSSGTGILLSSSNTNMVANNTVKSGILLRSSSYNNMINNTASDNNGDGIKLESNSDHNDIIGNNASNNNIGIYLTSSSNNTLSNNTASNNTDWDFYSDQSSHNNTVEDLTIASYPTTVSFTYDNGITIKGVDTAPGDPPGKVNISKYVNAADVTANSWLFLNVSYRDADISGMQESTLRMWKHNGSWYEVEGSGVKEAENYVYANITEFSIFAPLGNAPAAPGLNCTCGDICVNTTGWWRNGGTFNESGTPIQHAIDNATAGDTICVKDGTYNENVDVTESHLTIQSDNGSASCTIQTASSDDHVFEVTEGYVNISGFTVKNATSFSKAGIYLINAEYCNISDNNATDNYYGVYLRSSSNNTLTNNAAKENSHFDLYIHHATSDSECNNTIENMTGSRDRPIKYYNSSVDLSDVTLSELILCNADYSNINNVTIEGSSTKKNNGVLLVRTDSSNLTNINSSNNEYGIYLWDSSNNTLLNNNASNNYLDGILLYYSSDNNLTNNNASNNGGGIHLVASSDNTLLNNNASNNGEGIPLYYSSNNNTITNNTVNSNAYGFDLYSSSNNNTITNNTVTNNWRGIRMYSSSNNLIYNNYFNNTNNAYDDGNNIWNITKTAGMNIISGPYLGGNYWSDYEGSDENGDGLGDTMTPYNSSGNIVTGGDYLPLMPTNVSVETSTGTGTATFSTDPGEFADISSVDVDSLPQEARDNKPVGLTLSHGLFNFTITGLTPGQSVNLTITLPSPVPVGWKWWKVNTTAGNNTWYSLPIGDDNGDNVVTLTLTDGGLGDNDGFVNGVIVDPGGPGAVSDTTPPASVSDLDEIANGTTWILWNWTNPSGADFNHTEVWIDGEFKENVTTPEHSYNATGLAPNTIYEIGTRTVDNLGNVNQTWMNDTAKTLTAAGDTITPVIESVTLDAYTTIPDATIHVTVEATDNVGVTSVTADGTALADTGSTWEGNITAPSTTGDYTLTIRAEDAVGNSNTTTVDYSVVNPSGSIGIGVDPRLTTVTTGNTAFINLKLVSTENFDDVAYVYVTTAGVYPGYEANLTWFNETYQYVKVPKGAVVNVPLEVTIPAGESGYKVFYAKLESTKWTPTAMDTGILYITPP